MGNEHWAKAKKVENDEFYTRREDIDTELEAYLAHNPDIFRGKTVYFPADRARGSCHSAFWDYFKDNATRLGLRKLIATSFRDVLPIAGQSDEGNGDRGAVATLTRNTAGDWEEHYQRLEGDGDLRSWEVHTYYLEADVVVTNPPFSCLKDLIEIVHELGKAFLLVVPFHALNYRRVFQTLWRREAWLGTSSIKRFQRLNPDGSITESDISTMWLTNLCHGKQNKPLPASRTMAECRALAMGTKYEETLYQPYDNLDAIEVPRLEYLPTDYDGLIGVPLTVLPYLCGSPQSAPCRKKNPPYTEPLTPSAWEALWKPKPEIPFYEYGLVETRKTRAPREGKMRDYWGCTLGSKVLFTRIIVRWTKEEVVGIATVHRTQNTEHRTQNTEHPDRSRRDGTRLRSASSGWYTTARDRCGTALRYAQPRRDGERQSSVSRGLYTTTLSIVGRVPHPRQPLRNVTLTQLSLVGIAHNYKGASRLR